MLNNAVLKSNPNYEFIEMEKVYMNQLLEGNTLLTFSLISTFISQSILTFEIAKTGSTF